MINQLTNVWEQSEKATHLIVAENGEGFPVGFMGIKNRRIEILFISPEFREKDIVKEFIQYGIKTFFISEITVNE